MHSHLDRTSFGSIQKTILHETKRIALVHEPNTLAECYLSRGESFLLLNDLDSAAIDLRKGYEITECLHDKNIQEQMRLRLWRSGPIGIKNGKCWVFLQTQLGIKYEIHTFFV
jgi:hypothetical protein